MEWSNVILLIGLASAALILRPQVRSPRADQHPSEAHPVEKPPKQRAVLQDSRNDGQAIQSIGQPLPPNLAAPQPATVPVQELSDEQLSDAIDRAIDAYSDALEAKRDATKEDGLLQALLNEENKRFPEGRDEGQFTELADDGGEEEDYFRFVEDIWTKDGIDLGGIRLRRDEFPPSDIDCQKLVWLDNDRAYVCGLVDGRRRVFSCVRGRWFRDGQQIDNSAFYGVSRGLPPSNTLRPQRRPSSVGEALMPEFNSLPASEKSYVLKYENSSGQISYRVISRVLRHRDYFSALCHYRYGQRRKFFYEGIIEVISAKSGEVIGIEEFLSGDQRRARNNDSGTANRSRGKRKL